MTRIGVTKKMAGMKPGNIVILLTGPHAGRRAVVLKSLEKNRIVVTGPQSKVPLTRIPITQVIKTSTSIDISKLDTSKVTDKIFRDIGKSKDSQNRRTRRTCYRGDIINKQIKSDVHDIPQEVLDLQKSIDNTITNETQKDQLLTEYLTKPFSLDSTLGLYPHELKF